MQCGFRSEKPWSLRFGHWSFPLRLFLRRQEPLGVCVLFALRRLGLGLCGRPRRGCAGATAAGVGKDLIDVARGSGDVLGDWLTAGGTAALVELAGDGRFAISEAGQPLVRRGLLLMAANAVVGVGQ